MLAFLEKALEKGDTCWLLKKISKNLNNSEFELEFSVYLIYSIKYLFFTSTH